MKKQLVISISALALIGSLAAPVFAASSTTTAGATVNAAGATVGANGSAALTLNDVSKDKPFGDNGVDQSKQPTDEDLAKLTDTQRDDLSARCDVIMKNSSNYDENTSFWCQAYSTWYKKMHPG
jgi:hypothetical protein